MKTLTVLVLVQTGVLLLLLFKIAAIEKEMPATRYADSNAPSSDAFDALPIDAQSGQRYSYPSEDQLRNIIREEFEAYLVAGSGSINTGQVTMAAEPDYTAENQYQLDGIAQKLDYFESVGRISEMEMLDIQMDIAKLHKSDRGQMLKRLVRTMNTGDVKGHL